MEVASHSASKQAWPDDGELSDEQIEQLLKQAEQRLQQNAKSATSNSSTQLLPRSAKLDLSSLPQPYVTLDKSIARIDEQRLLEEKNRKAADGLRKVEDPLVVKQKKIEEKKATAGTNWFNLPRTNLTPELKRDLQLLKMRSVLDPKRFYKKESAKSKPPEFSHVGTLIEGPTEFFSGRLTNRERKRTFVEQVLDGEQQTGRLKRKYEEIQAAKTSGKKAHYKAMMAKRNKDNLRR